MSKTGRRFIDFGTGTTQVNGGDIPSLHNPANYTEDSGDLDGHLSGIDESLGDLIVAGDLAQASSSLSNNQSSSQTVTGLNFANGTVRSAVVNYSILVDADSDLYEEGSLRLIQKAADWEVVRDFSGDDSLVDLDVNSSGQITYKTPNYSGFVSATIKFRATVTGV